MFIRCGDLTIHVTDDGPVGAPALLLLHSIGTSSGVWDFQARRLAGGFRVIRPDLRGHGLTAVTPGPYSITGLARDVLAVLNALHIEAAHIGGVSLGGMVAQSLAEQAPGRVLSLILCDTALAIPPAAMWRERAAMVRARGMKSLEETVVPRWITPAFLATPEADGLRAMLLRTSPEGYAGASEAIAAADLSAGTGRLSLPTLVMVGDQDQATPLADAKALAAAIVGAHLEVIAHASHLASVEQAEAVTEAMLRFLSPRSENPLEAGMAVRSAVLGEAHVARALSEATPFDRDFQAFITRTAWGGVWTRPQLDRRTRSLLTLALLAALGHQEEFKLHVWASRNTGASAADIAEVLMQVAVYAGIPAANSAVRIAKATLAEMAP